MFVRKDITILVINGESQISYLHAIIKTVSDNGS